MVANYCYVIINVETDMTASIVEWYYETGGHGFESRFDVC